MYNLEIHSSLTINHFSKHSVTSAMDMNTTTYQYLLSTLDNHEDDNDRTAKMTYVLIMSCVFILGLFGNTLILVVMCNQKFDKTSTSLYLSVLAVSDTSVLLSGPLITNISLHLFDLDLRKVHISLCWIFKFFIFWGRLFSSWCLVAITVERMLVVLKPHK